MLEKLTGMDKEAQAKIAGLTTIGELNEYKVRILGRKGELTALLRGLKDLSPEQRAQAGKTANEIKDKLEEIFNRRAAEISRRDLDLRLQEERVDVTLPGIPVQKGGIHPLTRIRREITRIFTGMGFTVEEGPEIELDYYNFEALNVPKHHPARDMQDSFYITDEVLLRTHTSPVQVRVMEKTAPQIPVKIIVPGTVYRNDDDATHSPMFHQVEGLLIDEHITFADLKGILMQFAREMFGAHLEVRYRPSFFPFTEPSVEIDISCVMCGGQGCRVCSRTGWLEILGAGMVHPNVLRYGGYDPEKVTGFAFGMGIERIAMLKYGINDLRLFYENDKRFLMQF